MNRLARVLACLLGLATPPALAVDLGRMYEPTALAPLQQNYAGFVRQQLLPVHERLTAEERARVPRLNVDVPMHGPLRAPFEFTSQGGDNPHIDLPASAIRMFSDAVVVLSWLGRNGYDARTFDEYLGLLKHEPVPPPGGRLPDPIQALGVPRNAAEDAAIQADARGAVTSMLRFVLLHELGHVIDGDAAATGEAARAKEIRADAFAIDMMRRLGAMPNGLALMMSILARLQPDAADIAADARAAERAALFRRPFTPARARALAAALQRSAAAIAARQPNADQAAAVLTATVQQLQSLAAAADSDEARQAQRRLGRTARWTLLAPRRPGEPVAAPAELAGEARAAFHGVFDGVVRVGDATAPMRLLLWRTADDVVGVAATAGQFTHLSGRVVGNRLRYGYEADTLRGEGALESDAAGDALSGEYGAGQSSIGGGSIAARRRKP